MMSNIDSIDAKIIILLQEDGRMPAAVMARRISGVSERIVHHRIGILLQKGVIRVSAILDPRTIGYTVRAEVFIKVESGCLQAVTQKLAGLEEVSYAAFSIGNHHINVTVLAHDNIELYNFLAEDVANVPGIKETSTFLVPLILKDPFHWFNTDFISKKFGGIHTSKAPFYSTQADIYEIDKVDQAIIHLLLEDGRMPAAEIARKIDHISAPSVRSRIKSLLHHEVIRVSAIVNPETLGFLLKADVILDVESAFVLDIAKKLAQLEETSYVGCSLEKPNISIQLCVRDDKHLFALMSDELYQIPGVNNLSTNLVPLIFKEFYAWRIPDSVCLRVYD